LKPLRLPAAFLAHGSPMNALETNRWTRAWASFGKEVPKPRAILMVSAHWYVPGSAVTAMARPRTIHDFQGFPKELFEVSYPAAGDPALAGKVAEIVKPVAVELDREGWGLDHGAWSVLKHVFPGAEVPVVQFSIDLRKSFDEHLELGRKLAPLREEGVLILASGNVVHNLRALDWKQPETGFDWAHRFDAAATEVLTRVPGDAPRLRSHADYVRSAPTPDHFIPLLYLAGLAEAAGQKAEVRVDGCAYGSLSMTSYSLPGES